MLTAFFKAITFSHFIFSFFRSTFMFQISTLLSISSLFYFSHSCVLLAHLHFFILLWCPISRLFSFFFFLFPFFPWCPHFQLPYTLFHFSTFTPACPSYDSFPLFSLPCPGRNFSLQQLYWFLYLPVSPSTTHTTTTRVPTADPSVVQPSSLTA